MVETRARNAASANNAHRRKGAARKGDSADRPRRLLRSELMKNTMRAVITLAALTSGACKGPGGEAPPAQPAASAAATPAAAPAATPKAKETGPIKVGILHSLSGTMAISETSLKDVALMTIEGINK